MFASAERGWPRDSWYLTAKTISAIARRRHAARTRRIKKKGTGILKKIFKSKRPNAGVQMSQCFVPQLVTSSYFGTRARDTFRLIRSWSSRRNDKARSFAFETCSRSRSISVPPACFKDTTISLKGSILIKGVYRFL